MKPMPNLTRQSARRLTFFTADMLKIFATVMMLCQTVGIAIFQHGLMHMERFATSEELEAAMSSDPVLMNQAGIATILEFAGGLAVPLFTFLLVEGFKRTSNRARYVMMVGLTAVISEVPFDMAYFGVFWNMDMQNGMISMAVALLLLCGLKEIEDRMKGIAALSLQLLATAFAIFWVTLIGSEYGIAIVPLAAVFYLLYDKMIWKLIIGIILTLPYVTSPMAFYGIYCYNEKRTNRLPKYFYYAFYPVHLVVLSVISKFFI